MGYPEFRVIEEALGWDPAEVTVPSVPGDAVYESGVDPVGILVNAVMPDIADDLNLHVANTRAREEQFAANLRSARSAYHGTDSAGQEEIYSAASRMDPADGFGAGYPSPDQSAATPAGDASFSQLTQMMGLAMQAGPQAVQAPMQVFGVVGQMAQPVTQSIHGAAQQAMQAAEKSRGVVGGESSGQGTDAAAGGKDGSQSEVEKNRVSLDQDARFEDANEQARDQHREAPLSGARGENPLGTHAPTGPTQAEPLPPRHPRRVTETAPEVAL